jgi:hypothetical protein
MARAAGLNFVSVAGKVEARLSCRSDPEVGELPKRYLNNFGVLTFWQNRQKRYITSRGTAFDRIAARAG